MSSSIPTRRVTRASRPVVKEDENVHARPSRIATRAKPAAAATGGASRAGSAQDATAQGKRKREALGEVTTKVTNNRLKGEGKGKEKEKEKDDVTKHGKYTTTTRQPLRSVASRSKAAGSAENVVDKAPADDMVVDPPSNAVPVVLVPAPPRAAGRPSHIRKPSVGRGKASVKQEPEPEEEPLHKKRRTSSDTGDEEQHLAPLEEEEEEEVVEVAADVEPTEDWEDLDKDDEEDPLMVSEYVLDIFNYLKELELVTMPNPNYMENQKDLAWKMRGILIDWLIQLHSRFTLLPETLFLCVNIIDRFLSARIVSLPKLQLVGVTCMFIAAKVEETIAPSVKHFVDCADSTYAAHEILTAEKYILKTIDWNLSYPNPLNFLRRISKADEYSVPVRTVGKFFLEVCCLEWRLLAAPPSLMAAASMYLARLVLDQAEWTPNLRHYSSYPESALLPTATLIINYLLKPMQHEAFYKKYASKKFLKASVYVRTWCLERWDEKSQIDLAKELPQIKEDIRLKLVSKEAQR